MTTVYDLAKFGMAVVEVAPPKLDGTCSCRRGLECPSAGKHALGANWAKRAIINRERRPNWLPPCARLTPTSSYGLLPVPGSGMLVVDRDDPMVLLPLPEPTFEVHRASADPRKGHFYYLLPDDISEADVPRAFAGGEIRISGSGFVVGPGCRHASGDLYEGNGADVAFATHELIDALNASKPVRRSHDGHVEAVLGSRRSWLTQQARKMRGWDYGPEDIIEELRHLNEAVCSPSLTDAEFADVERAVDWAMANITPDVTITVRRTRRPKSTGYWTPGASA